MTANLPWQLRSNPTGSHPVKANYSGSQPGFAFGYSAVASKWNEDGHAASLRYEAIRARPAKSSLVKANHSSPTIASGQVQVRPTSQTTCGCDAA